MKVKRIEMSNIGPYQGQNTMKFCLDEVDKNIILIGGKNGAGKSTIFTALKVGIYGCRAFGLDVNNAKYYAEVEKIINSNSKVAGTKDAYIYIELLLDDGKEDNLYIIKREWIVKGGDIKENVNIFKNNQLIKGEELQNFLLFLNSTISPELFNFYFFDGEKIGDYFLSSESNQNFRKAFLSICGIDSISLMVENFERIIKRNSKTKKVSNYYELKEEIFELKEKIELVRNCLAKNEEDYQAVYDDKTVVEQEYAAFGGLTLSAWKEINKQVLEEEALRETLYKKLREIALVELPYLIVKQQAKLIKSQIEIERDNDKEDTIRNIFNDREIFDLMKEHFCVKDDSLKLFFDKLLSKINTDNTGYKLLDLSTEDKNKLLAFIFSREEFDKTRINKIYKELEASRKRSSKARKKIETSNIDKIDDFVSEISSFNNRLLELKDAHEKILTQLNELLELLKEKEKEFEKAKRDFEKEIKESSVTDIAGRAYLAFKEAEERITAKFSKELEMKFIQNFNMIINKSNFIDGIIVDEKLNVKPYKNRLFKISNLKQLKNNYGEDYLVEDIGIAEIDRANEAILKKEKEVILPVIIKTPFSQGEKQVYIMSLYISLLQISHGRVPFIIDTPFARIDSEHREKIIEVFFKKLDSQILILSTDEEIIGECYNLLKDRVADKFLLESLNHGVTTIIENQYFGDLK